MELVLHIIIGSVILLFLLDISNKLNLTTKKIKKTNKKEPSEDCNYNISLAFVGFDKLSAIKQIAKVLNTSLKQAESLAYQTPFYLKKQITFKEAQKIKSTFEKNWLQG